MKIRIALAQCSTKLSDVAANLQQHMTIIENAKAQDANLVIFPELSLTGYALQDLAVASALRPYQDDPVFNDLLTASRDIDLMVGFVHEDRRHRFYIASAYLSEGQILHIHNKVYLPTYGMFDEGRFFAWGDSVRAFDTKFGRFGMLICEDFWHASLPYLLWLDGADVLLFSSASPGRGLENNPRLTSSTWVEHTNRAYAGFFTVFVAHTNRVGFEDGLNFWGGSTIFDPDGKLVVRAPDFDSALTISEIDLNQLHRSRAKLPLLRDERTSLVQRELERILCET
ncbi:MAG: nitrilase-related carbon-nitrogen hydrolase [Chloroflexota bacterium]|nr:nitrilase-related carbon-nitrogen hydrolase [Chloroflexota bacterium]